MITTGSEPRALMGTRSTSMKDQAATRQHYNLAQGKQIEGESQDFGVQKLATHGTPGPTHQSYPPALPDKSRAHPGGSAKCDHGPCK